MRGIIGVVTVLALSVTVAVAQQPRSRTASLLPPLPLDPAHEQPVARGVSDEIPLFPGSTPVARPTPPPGGPAWLNGGDPNVRPASGTISTKQPVRPLTPPDSSPGVRGFDKLKSAFTDVPAKGNPKPGTQPAAGEQANAGTPFRGTGPNGAPVYAGPPAWRWNGYGAPTPGANPLAPHGQYPGASANWYSITGATPGAFPTPVTNPARTPAGTEPPVYATTPGTRMGPAVSYTPSPSLAFPEPPRASPPASPPPMMRPTAPPSAPVTPPSTSFMPLTPPEAPVAPVAPVTVPTITQPPLPVVPLSAAEPEPVGPRLAVMPPTMPMPAIPPMPRVAEVPSLPAVPVMPEPKPVEAPKPPVTGLPAAPEAKAPTSPAALPPSVTDENLKWQPKAATPIPGVNTTPAPATIPAPPPNWQQSRGTGDTQFVARGQVGENRPDVVATLIRKMCDGRAEGVEVRWTGSKRVTVCFECRTAEDARQLVKDISARPELAPLQIDFCVLVK